MKLTAEKIVDAGMATLAETGYRALSMRKVAERLDAHAGSLYYHVRGKPELLALMADRVTRHAYDAGTRALAALPDGASWPARVEAQAVALRGSILTHTDGAVLLAGSPRTLSPGALAIMERLLGTLGDAGVPADDRGVAADTLLSHVTGFVLQEQSEAGRPDLAPAGFDDLRERFPLVFRLAGRLDEDEKFRRSVRLICTALGARDRP